MHRFPFAIDPNNCEEQVGQILAVLKPKWKRDEVKRKNFSEGYMNVLLCFHLASDPKLQDAVIFRIAYDVDDPKRLLGATKEEIIVASQVAQASGSGAPVLALFKNGLVTKCLPGKAANRSHLREERLIRDEYFSKENLRKEIKFAENFINGLGFNVIYSHNDFHCKNLVYDQDNDEMMIIDFDISGFNHEGFDIGALLEDKEYASYLGFCGSDDPPDMTDDELRLWAKYYLQEKAKLKGLGEESVSEKEIDIFALKCRISTAYFHLMSMMWALSNHNNPQMKATDTFSIVEVAKIDRKLYEEGKTKFAERVEKLNKLQES